jgi:SOS-response transcriptional repressor LexA
MLTEAQDNLWRYLHRTSQANGGVMPSYREMCRDLGYSSLSTPHGLIDRLIERGYASRQRSKHRALMLLKYPSRPRAA